MRIPANQKIKWIKGRSGNTLQELADRHAAKEDIFQTYNRTNKIPRIKTKSVFYVLLPMSGRGGHKSPHSIGMYRSMATQWRNIPSQGKLVNMTKETTSTLPPINMRGISSNDSKLYVKYVNYLTHSPKQRHQVHYDTLPTCPLCGHPQADEEHVLMHCPHIELESLRTKIDQQLTNTITPDTYTYS